MYKVNTAPGGGGRKNASFWRAIALLPQEFWPGLIVVVKQRVWLGWTSDVLIYATNFYNLLKTLDLLALQQFNKCLR